MSTDRLRNILNVLQISLERRGDVQGYAIGCARGRIGGLGSGYEKGSLFLFHTAPPSRLDPEMEVDDTVIIEAPMKPEAIREQEAKGSLLTTMGTMVGVPRRLVHEAWSMPEGGRVLDETTLATLFHSEMAEVRVAAIAVVPEFLAERARQATSRPARRR